jgi:hypothetical protein
MLAQRDLGLKRSSSEDVQACVHSNHPPNLETSLSLIFMHPSFTSFIL